MITWAHNDVYSANRELVLSDLASALFQGELALFLGAGVSRYFDLPSWPTLLRCCLATVGLPDDVITDTSSFEDLIRTARDFREECPSQAQYLKTVRECLYKDASDRGQISIPPLLTALGALMMGSRRGRVKEVWTLNYDDALEWHLRIHGFVSQVVTNVPCILRDVDVTVYHPHGYLPLDERHGQPSQEIVFDDKSYANRSVGKSQPWRDAVHTALRSKIYIAIGLSWTDGLLKNLIVDAASDITDRPTAFWFFGPECSDSQVKECLRNNVVPVRFDDYADYAPFILRMCEGAAEFYK